MTGLKVKDWFLDKIECPINGFSIWFSGIEHIVRETEKAYLVIMTATSKDGEYEKDVQVWIPKSCVESKIEYDNRMEKALEDGKARYEKLLAFAKEHGLNVRNRMKSSTIKRMIEEAGLTYEA